MCNAIRPAPRASSLSHDALRGRLRELVGNEREAQVDFLLHLAEFDRRKGYLDAGHGSIWTYCLRELRLREGPAARRIAAMRVLRQYAALEAPLRDGRLCLTTVTLIAPLLSEFGVGELVDRAANLTKAEVEHLVATLRPGSAPRDGVRQLASRHGPPLSLEATRLATPEPHATVAPRPGDPWATTSTSPCAPATNGSVEVASGSLVEGASSSYVEVASRSPFAQNANGSPLAQNTSGSPLAQNTSGSWAAQPVMGPGSPFADPTTVSGLLAPRSAGSVMPPALQLDASTRAVAQPDRRSAAELRPVTADQWSLRVTMDTRMKDDLETLRSLLSHSAGGDLAAVVREALRCAIEKHGKRRGAIAPSRTRSPGPTTRDTTVPCTASYHSSSKREELIERPSSAIVSPSATAHDTAKLRSPPAALEEVHKAAPRAEPVDATSASTESGSPPTAASAQARSAESSHARSTEPSLARSTETSHARSAEPSHARSTESSHARSSEPNHAPGAERNHAPSTASDGPPPGVSNGIPRSPPRTPPPARVIRAAVRREVWARDQGSCSWRSKDGRRCGSRWKLELDHITPVALGGASTVDNLRLICRAHNVRHAEQFFGRHHMSQFRRSREPSG